MKRVMMFGPNSKDKALEYAIGSYRRYKYCSAFGYRRYVIEWYERTIPFVVLRAPDRRYAVCNFNMALKLEKQGFRAI